MKLNLKIEWEISTHKISFYFKTLLTFTFLQLPSIFDEDSQCRSNLINHPLPFTPDTKDIALNGIRKLKEHFCSINHSHKFFACTLLKRYEKLLPYRWWTEAEGSISNEQQIKLRITCEIQMENALHWNWKWNFATEAKDFIGEYLNRTRKSQ